MSELRSALGLARWLGPWAGDAIPRGVSRSVVSLSAGERATRAYVYEPPSAARGVYVVAQGLHYEGPADARLDRFLRVLAQAGFVTVAPFLRDFNDLLIAPTTADDLAMGVAHGVALARARGLPAPALFSVSFGSRPAIEVAASPTGDDLGALVLFGGYCDFDETVRFCVTGRTAGGAETPLPHDPLNAPVVHLNLMRRAGPALFDARIDTARIERAYREMVYRTWGRPGLKRGDARAPIARDVARDLASAERTIFMQACGLEPGGDALLERGLEASGDAFAWADPRALLSQVRPPVVIVHGRDDDVIPVTQAERLEAALPPSHPRARILTGVYGHTGAAVPGPSAALREISAMVRVTRELARAPRRAATARGASTPRG